MEILFDILLGLIGIVAACVALVVIGAILYLVLTIGVCLLTITVSTIAMVIGIVVAAAPYIIIAIAIYYIYIWLNKQKTRGPYETYKKTGKFGTKWSNPWKKYK